MVYETQKQLCETQADSSIHAVSIDPGVRKSVKNECDFPELTVDEYTSEELNKLYSDYYIQECYRSEG